MLLNLKNLVNYYAKVNKKLRSKDNKKEDSISKASYSVAGIGFEPVAFGL